MNLSEKFFIRGFGLILAFLLSLTPVYLLHLEAQKAQERKTAEEKNLILRDFRFQGKLLEKQTEISFWAELASRRLKHLLQTTHDNSFSVPPEVWPKEAKPGKVWVTLFPEGNIQASPVLCSGNGLEKEFAHVFTNLAKNITRQALNVQEDLWTSGYINRLRFTFGEGISKELFSLESRGKAFAVAFQGKSWLLAWDIVFRNSRPIAAFCLLFPLESDPALQAIRLLQSNWESQVYIPAFLPLSSFSETQTSSPAIVSKNSGRDVHTFLKELKKQMQLTPAPPQTDFPPVVNLLGSFLGKIQKFGSNPSKWAFLTPVSPLSGMIGLLFRSETPVPDGFLMSFTKISLMLVFLGWILAAAHIMVFRSFFKIGVRTQLFLWFTGIAAVSLAFSLGSASRYISDLEANKIQQLGEELTTNLDRLESFVKGVANKRYSKSMSKLDSHETAQIMLNAQKKSILPIEAMNTLESILEKENCQPEAIVVSGYKNFRAGKLVNTTEISPVAWKYIRESMNALRTSLFLEKDENIPQAILSLPEDKNVDELKTELGKMRTPTVSVMKWGREQVRTFNSGMKPLLIGTRFLHWQNKLAYLIAAFWNPQNLYEKLFKEILQKENEEFRSQDWYFSVFHHANGRFKDLGEDSSTFFDLRKYAQRALLQPVWEVREQENDVVFAYSSQIFPGFIMAGRASRASIENLLTLERARTGGLLILLLGLFALLAHILSRRISTPVLKMTKALNCIAEGNLQVQIQEDRKDELGKTGHDLEIMTQWLRAREKLSRFVSTQVLDLVGAGGYAKAMQGSEKLVAFLASDIRDFTTLSEVHPPQEIFATLNRHMDEMTQVIQESGGAIDRFIGDAVQAVFYADGVTSPSLQALRAAIGMKKRHLLILEERKKLGLFSYEIGFGIDSGIATIGVTGDPETRLDFSVLGNPVQKAPKLEASSKQGKYSKIVVSESVKHETEDSYSFHLVEGTTDNWELASLSEQNVNHEYSGLPQVLPAEKEQENSYFVPSEADSLLSESPGKSFFLPLVLLLSVSIAFYSVVLFFWRDKNENRLEENKRQEIRETLLSLKNTLQPTFQIDEIFHRFCLSQNPDNAPAFKKNLKEFALHWQKIFPGFALYFLSPSASLGSQDVYQFCTSNHLTYSSEGPDQKDSRRNSISGLYSFFLAAIFSEKKPLDDIKEVDSNIYKSKSREIQNFSDMDAAELGFIRSRSLGKCQILSMKGGSYALSWNLFWKNSFWQNPIEGLQKGLAGGIMFFIPEAQLTSQARWICFLENQRAIGNEVAVFLDAPDSRMLYATSKFRLDKAFASALNNSRETFQRIDDWVIGQTIVPLEETFKILIASRVAKQPFSQKGHWTGLCCFALLVAFIGVWSIRNSAYFYQKSSFSLRTQMLATFAFLLVHCLIFGGSLQNDSLQEMMIRLKTEKKLEHQDVLSNVFLRNNLFLTYSCNLWKERIRQPAFVNELDKRINTGQKNQDDHQNNLYLLESVYWTGQRGLKAHSLGLISPYGCFGWIKAFNNLKVVVASLFEREWQNFPGSEKINKEKKAADGFIAGEIGQLLRWLIPPIEFASWINAPQSLMQIFWGGDRDLYFFSSKATTTNGFPFRLFSFWESSALLSALMQELAHPADVQPSSSNLGCSFVESPGFSMAPPFFAYPHDWENPITLTPTNEYTTSLGYEIMIPHAPEISHLLAQSSGSSQVVTKENGNILMTAMPGGKLSNYAFFTWSSLAPGLAKFAVETRNVQTFFLVLFLLVMGFAYIAARYFLEPLRALSSGARKIMTRDFHFRLPADRTDEFGELSEAFNLMAQKLQEGKILRQFVSDSVQAATEGTSQDMIAGKGEKVEAVILFSALGNFKQKLETNSPQTVIPELNHFLGKMAKIVKAQNGDIDKFIGDKILAVFHAKKCGSLAQAQKNATDAALAMQDEMKYQTFWGTESLGVGIVPGMVLTGILGTAAVRLECTVIGDRVNLASRLCDVALGIERGIVLDNHGADMIKRVTDWNNCIQFKEMGEIKIKGKSEKIEIFQLSRNA